MTRESGTKAIVEPHIKIAALERQLDARKTMMRTVYDVHLTDAAATGGDECFCLFCEMYRRNGWNEEMQG